MNLLISSKASDTQVSLDSKSTWRIGRHPDNDIVIDDPKASRRHGRLVVKDDGFFYEDLGTGNGTLVSSVLIPPNSLIEIKDEDIIEIGDYKIALSKIGESASEKSQGVEEGEIGVLKDLSKQGKRALNVLDEPSTLIGRLPICQIRINDPGSSRLNTEIVRKGAHYHVRDLGSSNGTFLNDESVKEALLRPDDVVRVGSHSFQYSIAKEDDVSSRSSASSSAVIMPQGCSTVLLGLIIALVSGAAVYFLTASKEAGNNGGKPPISVANGSPDRKTAPVFVGQPLVKDIPVKLAETGNVQLANQDIIPFPFGQKVAKVHVTNGQRVKQGNPLVSFEITDELTSARKQTISNFNKVRQDVAKAQAQVVKSEAIVANAKANMTIIENTHDRSERVYRNGNLLQNEWDQILAKLADARAAVQLRTLELEQARSSVIQAQEVLAQVQTELGDINSKITDLTVTANSSGIVNRLNLKPGYTITSVNSTIEIIEYEKEVKVVVSVSEDDIVLVRKGMQSDVWLPRAPDKVFRGTVTFIPPTAVNRNYAVEITVPNKGIHFRPGQQVSVRFITETRTGSLLLPISALLSEPGSGYYIYTVDPETKIANRIAIKRGQEIAHEGDTYIEILPGQEDRHLSKDEWVITRGGRAVKEGMAVEIKNLDGFPE